MNNKPGRDLALALLGLGMLGSGLFLFLKSIELVISQYAGFGLLGNRFPSSGIGVFFIPMILGVILWVLFPKSIWPKVLFWLGIVGMILYIVSLFRIHYRGNLLDAVVQILLFFIGGALAFKKLVMEDPNRGKDNDNN